MAVASLRQDLHRLSYFAELEPEVLDRLARQTRVRRYRTGETILIEGAASEGLPFVISGNIRTYRAGAAGREHVLRVLGPGGTFNDAAAFDEGPNAESAAALGSAEVGLVPRHALRALLARHPQVATAALRGLAARERRLTLALETLAARDVTARVAGLLLGCAGRQEGVVENAPDACARITHEQIAAMVGSVREVVQRALKTLERAGAIRLERARIRILDVDELERFAGAGEEET